MRPSAEHLRVRLFGRLHEAYVASLWMAAVGIHTADSKDEERGHVVEKKARRISDGPKKIA